MYNVATLPAKPFVVCFIDEDGEVCMPMFSTSHETMEEAQQEADVFTKQNPNRPHFAADMRELVIEE